MTEVTEARLHEWRIEPREYARQEDRRGRRHAFEHLDPARTALAVIDMVPFFVDENPYCRRIVPNIRRLADELRSHGGTVAWVLPAKDGRTDALNNEFYGPQIANMYAASGDGGLWPEFEVHDADVQATKTTSSAFFPGRSDLPAVLEERGIDTVIVTGTVTTTTRRCTRSTAVSATSGRPTRWSG